MSHFLVMVAGKNYEELLAPYSENLEVEEYSKILSEEEKKGFMEHYSPDNPSVDFEKLYEEKGKDWNFNAWRKEDGVWKEFSTYNPNSKWDCYEVGGRWSDYVEKIGLRDKKPIKANINFESFLKDVEERASARWRMATDCFNRNRGDQPFRTWKEVLAIPGIDKAEKRDMYHSQSEVKAFLALTVKDFEFDLIDEYLIDEEDYVAEQRKKAVIPFAFLSEKTGWVEKGSMGWFGISSEDKETSDWYSEFMNFFNSLPDDEEIHYIDCHI